MAKVFLKDVVQRIKDNVDKDNTQLEYYIGGEHFDSGEIRITKKGVIKGSTIGPAFHMRFQPRDVLLMSRNPHLKKAGVVDFEGICSDVSYVCRTKNEQILIQDFLPFIFQTNSFWDFAEANKKGSTNFFLNWSDFEKYEFELPSIEKQKMLADLLWSIIDVKYSYKKLYTKSNELIQSRFIEMFEGKDYPQKRLSDVCNKITDGTHKTPIYLNEGVVFISAKNIIDGKLNFEDIKYISEEEYQGIQKRCQIEKGDVLLTKSGSLGMTAIVETDEPLGLFESLAVLKYNRSLLKGIFLCTQMQSDAIQTQLMSNIKGVAVKHLHLNVISSTKVIVPPLDVQESFSLFVAQVDKSKFVIQYGTNVLATILRIIIYNLIESE